MKGTASDWT